MSVNQPLLSFGQGNAKLDKSIATFSIPAGHTCPAALECRAFADRHSGHITDGHQQQFRCYAATQEAAFRSLREARWRNFELLRAARTQGAMANLIARSLPRAEKIRIHASGDFYSQEYFDAWMDVAAEHPELVFYAYTKALNFWVARRSEIPDNVELVASYGGRYDELISKYDLKHSVVVGHPIEAKALGLEIDHDDSHAYTKGVSSFALLIHGTQPAGSAAAEYVKQLKAEEIEFSYARK